MPTQIIMHIILFFRYDGHTFCDNLKKFVVSRKRKGKLDKKIRYSAYCIWALSLRKSNIGPAGSTYSYPEVVLDFIRALAPNDVKGEIRPDAYKVTLQEFGDKICKK
jgi:hypothetical protein